MRPPRPVWSALALGVALVAALALFADAQQGSGLGLAREVGSGDDDIDFRHLTVEQGLPSGEVSALAQDALGFVWIGTLDGLVRYDGVDLREFRRSSDSTTLVSNTVSEIAPRRDGSLWVGTVGGLVLYDVRTERFLRVSGLPADDVLALVADSAGGAWVGTAAGLAHVAASGTVDAVVQDGLPQGAVEALYVAPNRDLWIGTGGGLARRDAQSGRVTTVSSAGETVLSVSTIAPRDGGGLWIGTFGQGLLTFDPATGRFTEVDIGPGVEASVVSSVHEDAEGTVWVGTMGGGLRRLTPGVSEPAVYVAVADDPGSLSDDQVTALMEDRQGILWVATYAGLDRFDRARGTAVRLRHNPDDPQSLASDVVLSVLKASDGTLYVGTDRTLDRSEDGRRFTHTVVSAPSEELGGRAAHPVRTLYEDRNGTVWVGTEGAGLYQLAEEELDLVSIGAGVGSPAVSALLEDRSGRFWIGTLAHGLALYDRETERVQYYQHDPQRPGSLSDNRVQALAQARDGAVWVGTEVGLCRLDRATSQGDFTCFQAEEDDPRALASEFVHALHAQSDGSLWVGTSGGLHRLDTEDIQAGFTRYTAGETDLPGDAVYGIVEDEGGVLWLSTNGGLARFEPITETFSRRLGSGEGVERTLNGATARASDGQLYFGSTRGLLAFYPQQLAARNANPPEVAITGVSVAGQTVVPGESDVLDVAAPVAERIELGPDQDYLTIRYAGLHFSDPAANTYRVRLDGIDDDWRDVGRLREVTYNTLPPGSYTFEVQAANADGVWSRRSASVGVVIHPPWWRTWWAILGFLLVGGYGVARADRWHRARLLREERERAERRETELRAETAEAEQRKAQAEAAALKAENDRKAAELERTREVEEANAKLEAANDRLATSLRDLRETQTQLIQSEKLASLGQLTAGIAHEIKNPLNFVNNFADLSVDLADELQQELTEAGAQPVETVMDAVRPLLDDLRDNARRIHEHGQRADRIVRAMLLHSRGGAGERGRVDLNRFVDEYANLAYHGARANDSDFQVNLVRDFAEDAGEVEIIPQEFGRVLINLITNAFHAVKQRDATAGPEYQPAVTLRTRRLVGPQGDRVQLQVEDNGTGIPAAALGHIFEPFFTTKASGEGTGLGLSLAHDIVAQAHRGSMDVESTEGEGTTFTVVLPDRAPASNGGPVGDPLAPPERTTRPA